MARHHRGEFKEGVESIVSSHWLLPAFCEMLQQSLAEIPKHDPIYLDHLFGLGRSLQCLGEMEGDIEHLELSLQYLEQTLNLIPEGHLANNSCYHIWTSVPIHAPGSGCRQSPSIWTTSHQCYYGWPKSSTASCRSRHDCTKSVQNNTSNCGSTKLRSVSTSGFGNPGNESPGACGYTEQFGKC